MRRQSTLVIGVVLLGVLTGCASGVGGRGAPSPAASTDATTLEPAADAAAEARAQSWLDGAVLPPGVVRLSTMPETTVSFDTQFYGWPCRPVAERTAYWTIAGADAAETVNWLKANPTADLIIPMQAKVPEGMDANMMSVGNVPAADKQEGVVYTVATTSDGVAIRAEVAAMFASAVCPSLPPGTMLGGVGQG